MNPTADRLQEIRQRLDAAASASGRAADSVQLVAVAKTATPETLQEAWDAGHRVFGHNRVQALEAHRLVLPEAEWHLLGPLQGRKVRRGLQASSLYQALGETKTLERMDRALEESGVARFPTLLQVNPHPEDGRYGCTPADLDALVDATLASSHVQLQGLMTLAQAEADDAALRRHFSLIHRHFAALQTEGRLPADALLSMGMSQDYETAVEEGANLVRVGRAIFPPDPESK
ncbi:MAG: YggS family pyridoxal phosphate-dependent enzyme [Planctomycetota bacterium]